MKLTYILKNAYTIVMLRITIMRSGLKKLESEEREVLLLFWQPFPQSMRLTVK